MPAVARTPSPGRGEGVEGLGSWLRYTITAVSSCHGCKGQIQCQVVETLTVHTLRKGEKGWTVLTKCDGRAGEK